MTAIFAQFPDVNWLTALFAYGPLGIMCAWLMWRSEGKLDALSRDIIAELRVLGHRFNGLTRAMLMDVASRDTTGNALKMLAAAELEKIATEDAETESTMRGKRKTAAR